MSVSSQPSPRHWLVPLGNRSSSQTISSVLCDTVEWGNSAYSMREALEVQLLAWVMRIPDVSRESSDEIVKELWSSVGPQSVALWRS